MARKPGLPSPEQILEFLNSADGAPGKREIARAFGIRGNDRIALKQLLRKMSADGLIDSRRKRLSDAAGLPPVTVLRIVGSDADGELYGEPVDWDDTSADPPPRVLVLVPRAAGARPDMQPPGAGERILAKLTRQRDETYPYQATLIRKLTGSANRVVGIFRTSRGGGSIVPADRRVKGEIEVARGDAAGAVDGELVSAEMIADRGRGPRRGRIVERLGDASDQTNVSLIAIHHHGIPDTMPQRVIDAAATLQPAGLSGRTDMRGVPLITIDPPDARDHDDAVWANLDDDPANAGGFKVIVAIADVAAYVRPGSMIDEEARMRGNSVYFPDRVVPMLPERLSTDLCSLRGGEERPALACLMTFDRTGRKRGHSFERIAMRSAAKLSYEQAQAAIDGHPDDVTGPLLEPVLRPLWQAYAALSRARDARAPLELDIPERKLVLDAAGLIERVVTPERLDAHRLIEEFMIQANVAAAETLEQRKTPLIFRVHDAPAPEKLDALSEFLATINIASPKGQVLQPKDFNRILRQAAPTENRHLVNEVVLRSQSQAIYSPENRGHFGLNLRRYAHFTSPIRRYADLIVHRALISALGLGRDGLSDADIARIEETSELISATERRAMAAERETVDRLIAHHLREQVGASFAARISGVTRAGLFVALPDSGADGFIPAASLGREYFAHDEAAHALVGERSGETYRIGDRVDVRLLEVTPIAGGLRFEMLSEGKPGKPPKRRPGGHRGASTRGRRSSPGGRRR